MLKDTLDRVFGHFWWLSVLVVFLINNYMSSGFGNWYLNYPFQVFRYIYDFFLGWIPFPSIYIVLIYLVYFFWRLSSNAKNETDTLLKYWQYFLFKLLKLLAFLYVSFYILWGFNYKASTLDSRLNFDTPKVELNELFSELQLVTYHLANVRSKLSKDTFALSEKYFKSNTESEIRYHLKEVLNDWEYPNGGEVRVRKLRPKGVLMRISTAGVYIPFAMEGHIDAGLHPIQWPFTMAHEMSHGYGFTDEGTCNFIAYLVCLKSDDLFIQYSGLMGYWRYLMSNYRKLANESYLLFASNIAENIKSDLDAIHLFQDKYPDVFPAIRDAIYDSYLKSNGISEGLKSYSTIIAQCLAWQKTEYNRTIFKQWYEDYRDPKIE